MKSKSLSFVLLSHLAAFSSIYTQVSAGGQPYTFTHQVSATVEVKEPNESITGVPGEYVLVQNQPNPFDPATTIDYALPEAAVSFGQPIHTNADDPFEMGLKGGLVYSMIKDIDETFYPDRIINQYNPFFSLYLERRIGDISFEGNVSYKRLGFEVSRSEGFPEYDVDADFHYASVGCSINYYLSICRSRPRIFLGINYSFLIKSSISYYTFYSSFHVREDTALHERKKTAIPFILFGTGINLLRNDHLALELAWETGMVSPVKKKIWGR